MAASGRGRTQIRLDYKRLHRAADSRVPQLKKVIALALNTAYKSIPSGDFGHSYLYSPESFRRTIDWRTVGTILGAPDSDYTVYKAKTAANIFGEVFIDGSKTASGYLGGSLALVEPLAVSYGEQRAGSLILGIQAQQLATIRTAIGTGLNEGRSPAQTGRMLRATTGLSERQGQSLINYERGLTEKMLTGRTATVLSGPGRPLVDQRFALTKLDQQKIDTLVERYRERLVNYRAELIARTETIRAANMGAYAEMRAHASAGLFDAKTATRVWQVTPDDRLCEDCADLDGQTVGFDQSFLFEGDPTGISSGDAMSGETPPLHPQCRCTFYLDVSLESLTNAFRDGNFDFGTDSRTLDDLLGSQRGEGFSRLGRSPLPSLPRLDYLPPSVPGVRAGATVESMSSVPRARQSQSVEGERIVRPVEIPPVLEPVPVVTVDPVPVESPPVSGVKGKAQLRREAEYARQAAERDRLGAQYNAQRDARAVAPKVRKPLAGPNLKNPTQIVDPLRGIRLQEVDGNYAWKLDRQINRWTVTGPDTPPGSVITVVRADGTVSQQIVTGTSSTRGGVAQLSTRPATPTDLASMRLKAISPPTVIYP